jgi:hypothetical protein
MKFSEDEEAMSTLPSAREKIAERVLKSVGWWRGKQNEVNRRT